MIATSTTIPPRPANAGTNSSTGETVATTTSTNTATHYDNLNVSPNATYEEIKLAFHRLARLQHPDKQVSIIIRNSNNNPDDKRLESSVAWEGNNDAGSNFRRIQLAWQVLRDVNQRSAYDHELQQRRLHEESRRAGALTIHLEDDDVTEAIDPDTNEVFYVYECRCGEEIFIDNNINVDDTTSCRRRPGDDGTFVDCPGCCFVYRVVGLS